MKVSRFVFNMFGVNTYVVWDPDSLEAAVIDPGFIEQREMDALTGFIERNSLKVTNLINTHMHLDHIFGNLKVKEHFGLQIKADPKETPIGNSLEESVKQFHLPVKDARNHSMDIPLHDGEIIFLGKEYLEVISVPGHTPGGIALYAPESGFVITGDSLFQGSVGRTDLPGGNHAQLIDAIERRLMTLPPETVVLPGHGGETTIGLEKTNNPYL